MNQYYLLQGSMHSPDTQGKLFPVMYSYFICHDTIEPGQLYFPYDRPLYHPSLNLNDLILGCPGKVCCVFQTGMLKMGFEDWIPLSHHLQQS